MNPFISHGRGVRLVEVCAKYMGDHPGELIAGQNLANSPGIPIPAWGVSDVLYRFNLAGSTIHYSE
jgi:hypothetical protein